MAAHVPFTEPPLHGYHSIRQSYAANPATPVHSPHPSLASSVSSRTPLHFLTLHEYRKQQSTPTPYGATPPGKPLRRKPAASTLNGVERVPSVTRTPVTETRSYGPQSSRPLHFSQSAQQLAPHQPLPPSPPHDYHQGVPQEQSVRSQSAGPYNLSNSGSLNSWSTGTEVFDFSRRPKVATWKPIKRLPKPPSPFDSITSNRPSNSSAIPSEVNNFPLEPLSVARPRLSPLHTTSFTSAERLSSNGTQTGSSTISLSRFPQPPYLIDTPGSPPTDEYAQPHVSTNFTATAPATPPATPAVLHYRGASFDLVNPHDSLLFHDIVTPSRDFESTDYLPLRTSEEPLVDLEMAPKRSLYGDLSSAHKSIAQRRLEDPPGDSDFDLPLPPAPAAFSPGSSQYSSPGYSSEPDFALSPLAIKKAASDPRFSLKQLTRTLTKKLSKSPEIEEEELRDLSTRRVSAATSHHEGQYPRSLQQTYRAVSSPLHTEDYPGKTESGAQFTSGLTFDYPAGQGRGYPEPLTSLSSEDASLEMGRAVVPRDSLSTSDAISKPYYETSIYSSSSTYDEDCPGGYPPSLHSKRRSNAPGPLSYDVEDYPSVLINSNRDSIYSFAPARSSRRVSRPLAQDLLRRSVRFGNEKTDTLSKFIDEYGLQEASGNSLPKPNESGSHLAPPIASSDLLESTSEDTRPEPTRASSGLSQFDFGLQALRNPGLPPPVPAPSAPLASPFEDGISPDAQYGSEPLDVLSGEASYGDTRQLLQLSQPLTADAAIDTPAVGQTLEPSSSYSQAEASSGDRTPQEPLDKASQSPQAAVNHEKDDVIPAMWARRNSGNLLRRKKSSTDLYSDHRAIIDGNYVDMEDYEEDERGDWETLDGDHEKPSSEVSVADYSSTDGSRVSLGTNIESSLPVLDTQSQMRDSSGYSLYRHPSPLPVHCHPFNSSLPGLDTQANMQLASDNTPRNPKVAEPSAPPAHLSSDSPSTQLVSTGANADQPYRLIPWFGRYELSDEEAQEMINSGPNEEIIYEYPEPSMEMSPQQSTQAGLPSSKSFSTGLLNTGIKRENTFDKFSFLGPKHNLTGTPMGSGMKDAGSSLANTSSPGAVLSSSPTGQERRSGFYTSPGRTTSVTRIRPGLAAGLLASSTHERSPSETTLFPSHYRMESLSDAGSIREEMEGSRRYSRKPSGSSTRHYGRPAVVGQTKLRQMILAPDAQTISSMNSAQFPRFLGSAISERPSSSHTESPLRAFASHGTMREGLTTEQSPHLLCPERALEPKDEEERRKKSWFIFALFCTFPPLLVLYRWLADPVMVSWTQGRLGHCAPKPKKVALVGGIAINAGICLLIVVPIAVLYAQGAL